VEDDDYCERTPHCPTHEVWEEASTMLKNYFENISLQDLVVRSKKKSRKRKA
jgi:DNA-binding IscR family transcriptional regulator